MNIGHMLVQIRIKRVDAVEGLDIEVKAVRELSHEFVFI